MNKKVIEGITHSMAANSTANPVVSDFSDHSAIVHALTKNSIFDPLLSHYSEHNATTELNQEIERTFLTEFGHFKESLEVSTAWCIASNVRTRDW